MLTNTNVFPEEAVSMNTEGKPVLPSCQELQAEMRSASTKPAAAFDQLTSPATSSRHACFCGLAGVAKCSQEGQQSSVGDPMSASRPE